MKVEKNNNSIFRNKHVLVVVAVMCIFTIIACMGFMLSVPAHAEENIAPKTEPIAFSTPIETVNELDKAFPITETSEEAQVNNPALTSPLVIDGACRATRKPG